MDTDVPPALLALSKLPELIQLVELLHLQLSLSIMAMEGRDLTRTFLSSNIKACVLKLCCFQDFVSKLQTCWLLLHSDIWSEVLTRNDPHIELM